VQISNDGGATWSSAKSAAINTATGSYDTLGDNDDLWGLAWDAADFNGGDFRIRITNVDGSTTTDFSLDWLGVRVTYQP
jgi:hypothetical protein